MKISIIAAVSENNVIGYKGKIPWYLPEDLKRFKSITEGHHIIMGRITHESIGRPLPGRINVVISKNPYYPCHTECIVVDSLKKAVKIAKKAREDEIFIIGGGGIFKLALPLTTKIYLTKIHHKFKGDTFFPKLKSREWDKTFYKRFPKKDSNRYSFEFINFERRKT